MERENAVLITSSETFISEAIQLVQAARLLVVKRTNSVMVFTYFQLGRLIVEQSKMVRPELAMAKKYF